MSSFMGEIVYISQKTEQFKREEFIQKHGPRTGWPAEAVTPENIAAVEKLLKESRCITY